MQKCELTPNSYLNLDQCEIRQQQQNKLCRIYENVVYTTQSSTYVYVARWYVRHVRFNLFTSVRSYFTFRRTHSDMLTFDRRYQAANCTESCSPDYRWTIKLIDLWVKRWSSAHWFDRSVAVAVGACCTKEEHLLQRFGNRANRGETAPARNRRGRGCLLLGQRPNFRSNSGRRFRLRD